MKKKMASALTMCVAASLILTSAGVTAFASEVNEETKEETEELNADEMDELIEEEDEEMAEEEAEGLAEEEAEGAIEETSLSEPVALDWTEEQMTALSDIVSGMDDKEYDAGSASKYDIHMSVTYDKDVVRAVLFDTSDVDCSESGEYDVTYFVYFDREALLDYIDKNDLDEEEFPGLDETNEKSVMVAIGGKVTVGESLTSEDSSSESAEEEYVEDEYVEEEVVYEESSDSEPSNVNPSNGNSNGESSGEGNLDSEGSDEGGGTFVETVLDCNDPEHGYTGVFDAETGECIEVLNEW